MVRTVYFRSALFAFVAIVCAQNAQAQLLSDNFESGNDANWTHYDSLSSVPGGQTANYNVLEEAYAAYGASNHVYEISDPASTVSVPDYGPSRAGSLLEQYMYSDQFYTAIDLVNWETAHDEALGLLARTTTPGLGSTDGYALTYSVGSTELDLSRIDNESATTLALVKLSAALDPGHGYRLVFTGIGTLLTGQIFDDDNLLTPLATVSATDPFYAQGYSGLIVFDNTLSPATAGADATFDNFVAAAPEPVSPGLLFVPGLILLRRVNKRGNSTPARKI